MTECENIGQETDKSRAAYRIWHLVRLVVEDTTPMQGFVISAKTEQTARELACDSVKPEDSCAWLDRRRSKMSELGKADRLYQETKIIASW